MSDEGTIIDSEIMQEQQDLTDVCDEGTTEGCAEEGVADEMESDEAVTEEGSTSETMPEETLTEVDDEEKHGTPENEYDEQLKAISSQLQYLNELFEKKMLVDQQKNKVIENQGIELQQFRDGLYEKIFKPLLCDVADITDDLHRMIRAYENKDEEQIPISKFISILEIYESDMEDVLNKYGVEVYTCETEVFDPRKQKIVKIIETPDSEKNRGIAERVLKGFELEGRVLKPERVNVYRYTERQESAEPEAVLDGEK